MTMLSFRVDDRDADEAQRWAARSAWTVPSSCARRCAATSIGWRPRATPIAGRLLRSTTASGRSSEIADWGPAEDWSDWATMQRGEVWFAATPGGDRPVLVSPAIRSPTASGRSLSPRSHGRGEDSASELVLTPSDGVPTDSVVNFDNIHTIPRDTSAGAAASARPHGQRSPCPPSRHWVSDFPHR